MKKIYLACPYSDKDSNVEHLRFQAANHVAGNLMLRGHIVFSPLSHSVPIANHISGSNNDHGFWLQQDKDFLDWCSDLYVLCLEGWCDSFGVTWEIKEIKRQGKPITYVDENGKDLSYQ